MNQLTPSSIQYIYALNAILSLLTTFIHVIYL